MTPSIRLEAVAAPKKRTSDDKVTTSIVNLLSDGKPRSGRDVCRAVTARPATIYAVLTKLVDDRRIELDEDGLYVCGGPHGE